MGLRGPLMDAPNQVNYFILDYSDRSIDHPIFYKRLAISR
jgi:hypothetical protein